uniref:Uncharacterized protein n=1 Tax=Anguilla anguilla TaxID=7936 RepID=A0A0E9SFZ5_ANGAN
MGEVWMDFSSCWGEGDLRGAPS